MRDDEDRALHDHPWHNVSLLLVGQYIEVTPLARQAVHADYRVGGMGIAPLPIGHTVGGGGGAIDIKQFRLHKSKGAKC